MFDSLHEIVTISDSQNIPFWEVIINDDMKQRQVSMDESFANMKAMYTQMKLSDEHYSGNMKSSSGCVGGDGKVLDDYFQQSESLSGPFLGKVMARAIKMGESNACMKKIVAAPTAGSCGVIPAVFLTAQEFLGYTDDDMTKALFVSAGIGQIIAHRASISGAEGGCQAEIGSASAMAAGGIAFLKGGDNTAITHACAMSLKNLLGLTCDPVAGLVEVPCVKRNVIGAVNAISSADMALAGLMSFIPPDEVIDAMKQIGDLLPACLRETSEAGLATTPTGITVKP